MNFVVAAGTDIGKKRQQNQDNFASNPEIQLFAVADGMGGHRGGETASAIAVEVIPDCIRKVRKQSDWNSKTALTDALRTANNAIYLSALEAPELRGMGTTTTALLFKNGHLTIGHVGDSRCYYFRPNSLWQLTRDHSFVQEKLRAGLIKRSEVKTDRMKNIITRSVGFEPDLAVEIYEMDTQVGDTFLICSDGLSGMVEDSRMLSIVQKHLFEEADPQGTIKKLIQTANDHGGDDNITLVIIQLTNSS